MAAVATRSSLVGALLHHSVPLSRHLVFDFLDGLSRDELECLAEFQGACVLEELSVARHAYRLMTDFFDPSGSERWQNPDDRAHKMFVVLAYLDHLHPPISIRIQSRSFKNA